MKKVITQVVFNPLHKGTYRTYPETFLRVPVLTLIGGPQLVHVLIPV